MIILAHMADLPLLAHVLKCDVYAVLFCNAFAQVSRALSMWKQCDRALPAGMQTQ